MKEELGASATIEMALIFPVFMLLFFCVIYGAFYYHDKNIVKGACYETQAYMQEHLRRKVNQSTEKTGEELENAKRYFTKRCMGKLIFFQTPEIGITQSGDTVFLETKLNRKKMAMRITMGMKLCKPENYIRGIESLENEIKQRE